MYKTYEFTFAGTSASMFGMFVYDIGSKQHGDNAFGNQANIVETRLPRRITPLHYGVRYHDKPLEFTLIFGADHELDRYQIQEISNWLTGYQNYQWLSIDQPDMSHIQFHCLVQSLTPISIKWVPVAFEAKIVCDCPYGYSYPFEEVITLSDTTDFCFYNDSTIRDVLKPDLKIELAPGCTNFSIANRTTGAEVRFSDLPSGGIVIRMDNENEVIYDSTETYDLYDYFNFQFFNLASGDNDLVLEGSGTVTISGRYLYNVGA